ncbi:hypothetical protein KQI84_00175 [bacterium]|nr:hypothetical protein [bacterium]
MKRRLRFRDILVHLGLLSAFVGIMGGIAFSAMMPEERAEGWLATLTAAGRVIGIGLFLAGLGMMTIGSLFEASVGVEMVLNAPKGIHRSELPQLPEGNSADAQRPGAAAVEER